MDGMAEVVRQEIVKLIRRRRKAVLIPVRHRAKFEGWLQYELAAALESHPRVRSVEPERPYGNGDRCDLACKTRNAIWLIELKTCNTNWRVEGVEPKVRPIKMNVDGVIQDVKKLRQGCRSDRGLAAFLFFPVPTETWDSYPSGLDDPHLNRIEDETRLPDGSLRRDAKFVPLTQHFGIAVFVVRAA